MLHIDLPTRAEIEKLASLRGGPAVSLYLRTTPLTQDTKADRIELKNLLKAAVAEMEAADTPKRSIWPIQESIEALVEDDDFWVEQANSLAIFATPESIRTFRLANKLTNVVEVSDRFHLKPLIRSVTFPHHAYVLAIGAGAVRLIEVSADLPPHEVKVPDLPRDASQALGRRSHLPRSGDMRSGESTSENASLTRYARAVDQALRPVLAGHERPLIVAAAEPMASIFRKVCSYPHVAERVIPGSADHTPDHEIAASAREVLDAIYAAEIRELCALYATREAQGRATADIAQAARAATFGAVDALIVDMDATVPGTVDEEDGRVTFADQADAVNYGVVDEIARRALQSGARVVAARRADIPGGGDLAAILRYAI
jgi:Bacterial archaeo-eukaryotic release factor family 11